MTAKRTARLVLTLLAGLLLAGTAATTAQAEDGYRFWGYYHYSGGQWAFAQKGSEAVVPADGSVEGWRYAVGGTKPRVPRAAGDFNTICGATPAEAGKKRVALVIDPGTPADSATGEAPPPATGTCVVTDLKATGAKILAAVKPVRIEKGLACGIGGYPATGCGDPVKDIKVPATDEQVKLEIGPAVGSAATPTPAPVPTNSSQAPTSQNDSDTPWAGIIIAAIAVAVLATGGLVLSWRRSGQQSS
ncbi:SCO2322 family protein [Kribbella catacumbae]|uniref:SCO2322 family protein n=1 Tax=Kribbella catacumbae TaxID=460086 RepID=UPI00037B1BA4|nr:SCO2322 family protein [Kribbella catacumbae]